MNFIKKNFKSFIFLLSFVAIVFISMAIANGIQKDFGSIDVTVERLKQRIKLSLEKKRRGRLPISCILQRQQQQRIKPVLYCYCMDIKMIMKRLLLMRWN